VSSIEIPKPEELMEALRPRAGLLLAVGAVQAFLGTAAIAAPQVATPLGVEFFGVLLLLAAGLQIWQGVQLRSWKGTPLFLLAAGLDVLLGVILLLDPGQGAVALTLLLAVLLIGQGAARIVIGVRGRLPRGTAGFVLSGVLGLVLGGMLWWQWPDDSVWAIGLLLGTNLLMSGIALILLALALRGPRSGEPSPV
jgi:uncharacterized membrane protein HdeD (DUF308 family)